MSVSLTEVINNAGYDPANDVDDAKWFFAQFDDYDDLCTQAQELLDDYDDYTDWCESQEELGKEQMCFDEWRDKCLLK